MCEKVKPFHVRYRAGKNNYLIHHIYCGKCGKFNQRIYIGDKYCRKCGTEVDWSEENEHK